MRLHRHLPRRLGQLSAGPTTPKCGIDLSVGSFASSSLISSASALMQSASERLVRQSDQLVNGEGDLVELTVELSKAKLEAKLGAELARVANDHLGTLIDILA